MEPVHPVSQSLDNAKPTGSRLPHWLRAVALLGFAVDAQAIERAWEFEATLDGKPIGHHRFRLSEQAGLTDLSVETRFEARILGLFTYRYAHDATEQWRGGCLQALSARTNDDGARLEVTARRTGDVLDVRGPRGVVSGTGCVMSFAYWNPAILTQRQLLNPQTGEIEAVQIDSLGDDLPDWAGTRTPARHYRIRGKGQPIDVWYSQAGDWLALASKVGGGRQLRYLRRGGDGG